MLYLLGGLALFIIIDFTWGYLRTNDKKRYLIKNFIGVFVVILLLFLFGPLFLLSPVKLGYDHLEENNLKVFYPSGKIDVSRDIMKLTKEAAAANEQFYQTPTSTKVLVVTSNFDMLRFGAPPQAGGIGDERGITIRDSKASFNILAHEMSHRNLALITGKSSIFFPRWFDEGLASYIGNMDYYKTLPELKGNLLNDGRYKRDITSWKGLYGKFMWLKFVFVTPDPKVIYGQSYQMVNYLFEKYGETKVQQLVLLSKDYSFDEAFKKTIGISAELFHQEFIGYLQNQNLP